MKTIDEREIQKATKEKQTKTERSNVKKSYSKRVRAKRFCCTFKLGFLQLICKGSLIFKLTLELVFGNWVFICKTIFNFERIKNCLHAKIFFTKLFAKFRKFIFDRFIFVYL